MVPGMMQACGGHGNDDHSAGVLLRKTGEVEVTRLNDVVPGWRSDPGTFRLDSERHGVRT